MAEWLARPNTYAARQRERFGDVFTARIDPIPWVMLGDPDDVRTVFTAGPQRTNAGEANEILRPTLGAALAAAARRRRAHAPAQADAARLPRRAHRPLPRRSCARRPSARSRRGPRARPSRCARTRRRSRSRSSCAPSSASRTRAAMARPARAAEALRRLGGPPGRAGDGRAAGLRATRRAPAHARALPGPRRSRALRADRRAPRGARPGRARRRPLDAAARPRRARRADDATSSCATSS